MKRYVKMGLGLIGGIALTGMASNCEGDYNAREGTAHGKVTTAPAPLLPAPVEQAPIEKAK